MAKNSDPKTEQLFSDVNSLKQKLEYADKSLEKSETKIEKFEEKINSLSNDFARIQGSLGTAKWIFGTVAAVLVTVTVTSAIYLLTQNSTQVDRIAKLEVKVDEIQRSLNDLKNITRMDSLRRISSNKDQLKQSLPEVKKIISDVGEKKTSLPLDIVNALGEGLVEVAKDQIDHQAAKTSWEYAVSLASYRSVLNASGISDFDPRNLPPGMASIEDVTGDTPSKVEKRRILIGGEIKNFTFKDCYIVVKPGPISFNNVQFINCVFEAPQSSVTEKLLIAIFKEPSVTVRAG